MSISDHHQNPGLYVLTICGKPDEQAEVPRRYVERVNLEPREHIPGCTIRAKTGIHVTNLNIGLGLLLASRQIYHEALLKPFSEPRFYYNARSSRSDVCGLSNFVKALAPQQAKAITKLRLVVGQEYHLKGNATLEELVFGTLPGKGIMTKLKGLKDFEIVLVPVFFEERHLEPYSTDLSLHFQRVCMHMLEELRIRSLRITLKAEFANIGDDSDIFPTFSSKGETEEIEKKLRDVELTLHVGTMVAIDRTTLPSYAI